MSLEHKISLNTYIKVGQITERNFYCIIELKFVNFLTAETLVIDDAESVSPPHTPLSSGIRILPDKEDPDYGSSNGLNGGTHSASPNSRKRKRMMSHLNDSGSNSLTPFGDLSELLTGSVIDGFRFIEKFNRDMMDQFMEHQKRVAANQARWEAERRRQDQLAIGTYL